jgi:L-seryl-tRNA(Ser) seleniumtransferase
MMENPRVRLREIPPVEGLLRHPALDDARNLMGHKHLVRLIREVLDRVRAEVQDGAGPDLSEAALAGRVVAEAAALAGIGPVRVINATGVILHTNLGRAPLSPGALDAVLNVARGYSDLEYDLARGERGSRTSHVERLLTFLTGAEAGLAVNNNAAAVLLALNSLADGRQVLVSRGELVEIGGSFRIPDVMQKSGARLREVGTTNKTHPEDYENAISPETALLLKVHTSNYRIEGFTAEVGLAELARLGEQHGLPVMVDLGSGALLDVSEHGVAREPLVAECLARGADLVTFSGDKLLGGPQAGLAVGRRDLVRKLRENPLARAVRIDKLSLAALAATLAEFLRPEGAWERIPVLALLAADPAALRARAERLAGNLAAAAGGRLEARVESAEAAVGGGALPLAGLATWVVALNPAPLSADALAGRLRCAQPPVIVRIRNDRVLFDLRTISPEEEEMLPHIVARAFESGSSGS